VILETCFLSRDEKITACRLAVEAGMDSVKTSTGFGPGGATVEDVRLMKEAVAGRAKVKASGGIRDLKTLAAMLEAGADRIGTSTSVKILEEWRAGLSRNG
jgi:deoxyribose-phosphate aldolase